MTQTKHDVEKKVIELFMKGGPLTDLNVFYELMKEFSEFKNHKDFNKAQRMACALDLSGSDIEAFYVFKSWINTKS